MPGQVICRSDYGYIGYPLAFYWNDQRLDVAEIVIQNRLPAGYSFKVRVEGFGIFELDYDLNTDQWSVHQL